MKLLIKNGWIINPEDAKKDLRKGNIGIEGGIIKQVTYDPEPIPSKGWDKILDAEGKFVLPGLVNGHYHSYGNLVRAIGENWPLEIFMLYVMPLGRLMEPEDIYYSALLGCAEMLSTGTTCVVDHLAQGREGLEAAMKAYEESGMRAVMAPMITDKPYYSTLPLTEGDIKDPLLHTKMPSGRELLDNSIDLLKTWQDRQGRLRVMFGPSGPQRCSDELLSECARLAEEYDTGFHSHVLETRIQKHTADFLYHNSMIKHLDELGALNRRCSLVHAVWLSEEEIKLVAERGAMVVHNPVSNLNSGAGIAPINSFRKRGIPVALATDGANATGTLNLLESIKTAVILHKSSLEDPSNWMTAAEGFRMATLDSAKVALLEKRIGSLEVGKDADIMIFDPKKSFSLVPLQDPISQIVYGNAKEALDTVIIKGKVVVASGIFEEIDLSKIKLEVEKRSEKLIAKFADQTRKIGKTAETLWKLLKARGF